MDASRYPGIRSPVIRVGSPVPLIVDAASMQWDRPYRTLTEVDSAGPPARVW
jgi:hypothetical protein